MEILSGMVFMPTQELSAIVDMLPEILSGMVFVPLQELSAIVDI